MELHQYGSLRPAFSSLRCGRMNESRQAAVGHAETLLSWLHEREDDMARMLAELVSIPTENPPGKNYGACVDLLERRLRELGLQCQRVEAPNPEEKNREPRVSLVTEFGQGERTLYFHGHYDVVPAQSAEQFNPVRKEHFLFGRGSCDMKGGIMAMLYAILALRECGIKLGGRFALMLVPDEETGGAGGSAWLAKRGLLGRNGIGMLLAEPTSGVAWNANRGAISMRVRVRGKSAHVGLQHKGENAFERMVLVIRQLQEWKQEVEQRTTKFNIGADQARQSILLLGGLSEGGTNFNVVPEECSFTLDRRINPEEDLEEEKERLIAVLGNCRREGITLDWEIFQEGQSAACAETEPMAKALARSIHAVTSEAPRFEMCPGLLETRFYAAQHVPAYAYGPGLLSVAHGPDEYVDLRRVVDCAAVYALAAADMLGT